MIIRAVNFGISSLYKRYGKVLEQSVEENSPNTPIEIKWVEEYDTSITDRLGRGVIGHEIVNTLKTKYHNDIVQTTPNGKVLGMFDIDLMVMKDVSEIDQMDFDLAITTRAQGEATINSGVVFVRISQKTKKWYADWYENVLYLLDHEKLRKELKAKYLGINQSGLQMLLQKDHDLNIIEFPCEIWNMTPICYPQYGPDTKIVHILNIAKKSLQNMVKSIDSHVCEIVRTWKSFERRALGD